MLLDQKKRAVNEARVKPDAGQPVRIAGARRGRVIAAEAGRAWVEFPGAPSPSVPATLAAPLPGGTPELAIGRDVALVFEAGDPARPIIVGWMERAADPEPDALRVVQVNGRRVVLEASGELELRCGEASIKLMADGRVFIRGRGVSTQARELNRIRGAAVKIN